MRPLSIPNVERYVPALDGIRALAVLVVILSHFGLDKVVPGGFGVTTFFWISGFLITGQLVGEFQRAGHIDYRKFYIRRFIRLMPAAMVYIIITGEVFRLAGGSLPWSGWLAAVFYGENYYDMFINYDWLSAGVQNPLTHLWSLAVEEHYYIVWPVALTLLLRRRIAIPTMLIVCVVILAWRWWIFQSCFVNDITGPGGGICGHGVVVQYRNYKMTDARLDSIAWGALIALLAASPWRARLERLVGAYWVQGLALLVLLATFAIPGNWFREVWRYSIQGIALCVLVPAVCGTQNPLRVILETKPLIYIGRLSYSLYLWHWGAACLADWAYRPYSLPWFGVLLSATIITSMISYYGIEQPMVGWRRRFGSQATTALRPAA